MGHNTQTDRQTERILCSAVAELFAELIQTDRQTEFSVPQSPTSQSQQGHGIMRIKRKKTTE